MTRKKSILQVATVLFSEKGYKETSIAELSKISKVAEGTIFYHFNSKEELFLAVLEKTKETITEEFESYMGNKKFKNGIEMIEDAVSFYLYLAGKMEDQFLLLHRHFPYELAEKNSACRENLVAIYDCIVDIFEEAIQTGIQDGSMRQLHARKTALVIFSMVDGIARFKTYNLYNANSLFNEILSSCRRMLQANINGG
jgi:AcrR family transcriptional regulator